MPIEREAARAILITPDAQILLIKVRNPDSGERFWVAPGGGLAPGEEVEAGLRRELREEVGLTDCVIGALVWRRWHTFDWLGQRISQRERYHVVHVDRFEPLMSDAREATVVEEFRWWTLAELVGARDRVTPLSLADIVARYLANGPPDEPLDEEMLVD